MELLDPALDLLDGDAELAGDLALAGLVVGQEFVERRVEQADGDRQAVHRLEDADEVLLLIGLQRGEGLLPPFLVVGQDHLPHVDDPLALEEHVLGAAQADPLGAELAGLDGVGGRVGVGADLEGPGLVRPRHQLGEVARDRRVDGRDLADHDVAGGAVDGHEIADLDDLAIDVELALHLVDGDRVAADDAGLAPAAGDDRRVAGLAAGGREDALGQVHAGDVLGAGLLADQEDRLVGMLLVEGDGGLGRQDHLAAGRTRAGGDALGNDASPWPWGRAAAAADGSGCPGDTRFSAVFWSISPSLTISTAIRTAAVPVRLPVRVWSM